MYKVLLIDDEKPVRQAIALLGHWSELGIAPPYQAVEGQSGLAILREQQPDIVLVDMKMPNMDGVCFLEIAGREFPHVKYIVISGYDDFDYTKQAIRARVLDYLLKPVVESELNEALKRAVQELNMERRRQAEQAARDHVHRISLPLAKENLMLMIINNEIQEPLADEYREILQCKEMTGVFGITVFRVINFDEVSSRKFHGDSQSAAAIISAMIDESCSPWNKGFLFQDMKATNEFIQFLFLAPKAGENGRDWVAQELRNAVARLEESHGFYAVAGLGGFFPQIESLHLSFRNAANILNNVNLLDCRERVFTESYAAPHPRISLFDKKELLIYALESGNLEFTRKIITDYFNNIRNAGYFSLEYLQKTVMEFLVLLENITAQFQVPECSRIISDSLGESAVKSLTRLEDFSSAVYGVIEKIFHLIQSHLKTAKKENLYEIKDYIERHYSQDISLGTFAERYYLSKEYLSKLFKEEFGYTIYEYVLRVRMAKARELLADPEVKVLTVAERLGYRDNNYFSRAFKTYYGISPTEYRENVLKTRNEA